MKKSILYVFAAAIWGIPGVIISIKGIKAYMTQPSEELWWLLMITAAVILGFFFMFRKIVDRYCRRIVSLTEKVSIWQAFPVRGWILIVFMMCLGIVLKHIPQIPSAFTASFYSGLGPMLVVAAIRFIRFMTLQSRSDHYRGYQKKATADCDCHN